MDAATLANAMGNSVSSDRYAQLLPAFNDALRKADCDTVWRVAMFCAQVGEESGGLQWMEELASGAEYEDRSDLGNIYSGDGPRFKGRGPIQITGRFNYTRVSAWAFDNGYVNSSTFFVDNPQALADDQYGFLGAVWYWTVARNMNAYADIGDINGATRAVNGGYNGLQDRTNRWNHCRALGDALLPGEADDMFTDDDRKKLQYVFDQLGPGLPGWPQLGQNDKGQSLTFRDALGQVLSKTITLGGVLGKIASKLGA